MNIIVTGASRGIGFEVARYFSLMKGHHVLAISRNLERLKVLKEKTINNPSGIDILSLDLNDFDPRNFFSNHVAQLFQQVDILINNAGLLINRPFGELSDEDFDEMFHTNVAAPARLIKALTNHFSINAHVVNISSMGGYQGSMKFPGLSLYSASKGALTILTECLAEEFKDSGPKFNCLALGSAQTEMLEEAFPGYKAPVTADEMASFIADFALTGSKYFNGKVIPVSVTNP